MNELVTFCTNGGKSHGNDSRKGKVKRGKGRRGDAARSISGERRMKMK
jgi:hypothetical protein